MAGAPIARLWLAVLCGYLSIGGAIQVLPEVAGERFGASEWAVGAAITAASVAAVVARPLAGRRADARGPQDVVLLGASLAAAGALAQMLAPSLPALVAARLLVGAGEGALFTAAIAWVLAAAAPQRRGAIAGRFGLSMWGGLAAGPPLAALLAAAAGADAVWWACLLLPLPPALAVGRATKPAATPDESWGLRAAAPSESSGLRAVARPAAALALASFGYGTLNGFVVLRFTDAGFAGAGAALGVFGAAFLLMRLLGGRLADRIVPSRLVAGCAIAEAAGLATIALAPSAAVAFAGIALCGLGTALVYPALAALVAGLAVPARRGAALGALTSSWDAGLAVAGPLGGAVLPVLGLRGPFAIAALAAAAAALPLLIRSGARSSRGARSRSGPRLRPAGTAAGPSPSPRPPGCR
jgi:MFS family permease